jgi:hypothetical protein
MEATQYYGPEPVRRDVGTLLLLVAICPFGFLMWMGLFLAIQWGVSEAWDLAVGILPRTTIAATAQQTPQQPGR